MCTDLSLVAIQVNVCVLYHALILGSGLSSFRPLEAYIHDSEVQAEGMGGMDMQSVAASEAGVHSGKIRRPSSFWD
jgi:hypothetical protein